MVTDQYNSTNINMDYVVGIDGGGTKTAGILASRTGEIVAKVQAGPSNYHVVGIEQTQEVLTEIISKLSTKVDNIPLKSFSFCIGMAGLGREDDKIVIGNICDEIGINVDRILTHDAHIALVGGVGKNAGVIVISGTGSIVYGINESGKEVRAGGWGYLLGDEGSGYDIALKGLQAIVRAADRREQPTLLTNLVLKKLQLNAPNELIRWTHATSRDEIAQLAGLVFEAAEKRDENALQIIDYALAALACAVETVTVQLDFAQQFDIVFSGGILQNQPLLADKLQTWIKKNIIGCDVVKPLHEPAYGAVLLAMENLLTD